MQLKSLSKDKIKLIIWMGALVVLALLVSQLFRSINADQFGAQAPGTPQYPKGAAVNGVTVADSTSMTNDASGVQNLAYSNNAGLLTYQCDSAKGVGATFAAYPDDVSAAVATAVTDANCEYFTDIAPGEYIICAFASGEPVAKSVSEIYPPSERTKCSEGEIAEYTDNYRDLSLIVTPGTIQRGLLRVITKDSKNNIAVGASVNVKCDDLSTYNGVTLAPEGKFETPITPPEQNCKVTVGDYSGKTQTKSVRIATYNPSTQQVVTEVLFTVDMNTPGPLTQVIHKVFGIETAKAATTTKTVNRNTTKKKTAVAPKEVSQGRLAGWVTNADGTSINRAVKVKLILTGPAGRDNVSGRPIAPSYSVEKTTNTQGEFDFNPVEFTVNSNNTYRFEIVDPAFEASPVRVVVLGEQTATGEVLLNNMSKFNGVRNPYKQNGIQVFAQPKDAPSIKGISIIDDAMKTPYTAQFNASSPPDEFKGVSSFNYKGNGYPVLDKEYRVQFTMPENDPYIFIGWFDGDTDQPWPKTLGRGVVAQVTLTAAKKNVNLVAKVKKKTAFSLTGETQKLTADVATNQGTFTIAKPVEEYGSTYKFTYSDPKPGVAYTVRFQPDKPNVEVEGYYKKSDLNKKIEPPVFTLSEAEPTIAVIVKLKKSTTTLEVGLTPNTGLEFKSMPVDKDYLAKLTKPGDRQAIDTILNFAEGLAKRFIGTNVVSEKTFVHLYYRIPNEGIGLKVGNKNVGKTDGTGKVMIADATEWIDEDPEIQAIEGVLPACIHIHTETKAGGVIKLKAKSTYTPVTVTLNRGNPVIGELVAPDPRKIVGGQANTAKIDKNNFKPENFTMTGGQKNLGDGSNFFTHDEKLQRCMDNKSIEEPKIAATIDIPPTVSGAKETTVKLGNGESVSAKINWAITEGDGSAITDPNVKATIQIKKGKTIEPEQPIDLKGNHSVNVSLDGNKEQNYTITIRVRKTQGTSTEEVKEELKIKTDKKKN